MNRRNGYRERGLDTRVGTVELRVPKLRQGSYYPEWLFERRKKSGTGACPRHLRVLACAGSPPGGSTGW